MFRVARDVFAALAVHFDATLRDINITCMGIHELVQLSLLVGPKTAFACAGSMRPRFVDTHVAGSLDCSP